jgi:uncharacterized protein (TIGR02145 family)
MASKSVSLLIKKNNKMKKAIYSILSIMMLTACKKESSTSTSTTNSTNKTNVTCVDNPNINFTCIGTPIGKFGECIKDIDGNTYKTVVIGKQSWMAENLKTSKYNDGTIILNITDSLSWVENRNGAWCYYSNNDSIGKIYGKLYNWYTTNPISNGNKNICPDGWHVPNDTEWEVLINYLGGVNVAGGKMKEAGNKNWNTPNIDGTNISLFTGLGSGCYISPIIKNGFFGIGDKGYWWSSTEHYLQTDVNNIDIDGNYYSLYKGYSKIGFGFDEKSYGRSIRCIKD